jgi:hypothetical protein
VRCKEIRVVGAEKWRNRDEDLPADFEEQRVAHHAALRKPLDPAVFIDQLRQEMHAELAALDAAASKLPWLEIAERGRNGPIRLTDLDAAHEPRNLRRLKAEVRTRWGTVPLIDMLKEAVLRTGCLAAADHGGRPRRPGPRRARRAADARDLRLRHQHRHPRRRRLSAERPQRGRHPLRESGKAFFDQPSLTDSLDPAMACARSSRDAAAPPGRRSPASGSAASGHGASAKTCWRITATTANLPEAVRENEEVVPVNVSTWVLLSGVTVGR